MEDLSDPRRYEMEVEVVNGSECQVAAEVVAVTGGRLTTRRQAEQRDSIERN
jgi:hypothetical protein